MLKLGFIGTGKMAGAIIGGILAKGLVEASEIGVYDISQEQTSRFAALGCRVCLDIPSLAADCETLFLSVKPQNFDTVLPQLRECVRRDWVIVSIAAGIPAKRIKEALGFDCKVVLVMPNTPLLLGEGASALARVEPTSPEEFAAVLELFAATGLAVEIPADKMCEIIPVNGSSPAFVYLFAKTLVDCAVDAGLNGDDAKRLVIQTLIGSARMLSDSGQSAQELIDMVCSPGGATLAAMEALRTHGFTRSLEEAFSACIRRARELAES